MSGSRLRYTLHEAIGRPRDWSFTWALADDVTFGATCGFCGQSQQRITYEIRRDADCLWICRRCAGRYDLGGAVDGVALSRQAIAARVHGLTARLKQRTCHDVVRQCLAHAEDPTLVELAVYFERNLQLSPAHAARLFSLMVALPEPVDTRIFEVQTRSEAHRREFGALDNTARSLVWPALTVQQRRRLASLGFAPRRPAKVRAGTRPAPYDRAVAAM